MNIIGNGDAGARLILTLWQTQGLERLMDAILIYASILILLLLIALGIFAWLGYCALKQRLKPARSHPS